MNEKQPWEWDLADINILIENKREEDIHLDYKGADAISESKKNEITKDVSAFANSDGGVIIYGVKEYDQPDKKHLPEKIDNGIDPTEFSKEWLEQVINSGINPKIDGLRINPIPLDNAKSKYIYLIYIPRSTTVHQMRDKRYYKRYNFLSEPMEDYEIRLIMNRYNYPDLWPEVKVKRKPDSKHGVIDYEMNVEILNKGYILAEKFKFVLTVPNCMISECDGHIRVSVFEKKEEHVLTSSMASKSVSYVQYHYIGPDNDSRIFPQDQVKFLPSGNPKRVCNLKIDDKARSLNVIFYGKIYWDIFADNMPFKSGSVNIKDACG